MHLQSMANKSQPRRGAWADKSRVHNSMQFDMGQTEKQNIVIQDSLYAELPCE